MQNKELYVGQELDGDNNECIRCGNKNISKDVAAEQNYTVLREVRWCPECKAKWDNLFAHTKPSRVCPQCNSSNVVRQGQSLYDDNKRIHSNAVLCSVCRHAYREEYEYEKTIVKELP